MPTPSVMLCERTGLWAEAVRAALERSAGDPRPRIVETRSLSECRARYEAAALHGERPLLVVELTAENAAAVCDLLQRHGRRLPRVPRFVVGRRELQAWEPAVREAGAAALCSSPRRLQVLVDTYLRFRATMADEPEPVDDGRPLAERLWAMLPWGSPV